MKKLFFIFLILGIELVYAQDISGSWNWTSDNESNITQIVIIKVDSVNYKGYYCSVFNAGKKIDCTDEFNVTNIAISKMEKNVFVGSFKSSYSNTKGKLRLTFLERSSNLTLEIIEKPNGEFYLLNNSTFKK
jgi:hypothetical protein